MNVMLPWILYQSSSCAALITLHLRVCSWLTANKKSRVRIQRRSELTAIEMRLMKVNACARSPSGCLSSCCTHRKTFRKLFFGVLRLCVRLCSLLLSRRKGLHADTTLECLIVLSLLLTCLSTATCSILGCFRRILCP